MASKVHKTHTQDLSPANLLGTYTQKGEKERKKRKRERNEKGRERNIKFSRERERERGELGGTKERKKKEREKENNVEFYTEKPILFSTEAKHLISGRQEEPYQARVSASSAHQPKTFILGFSKGGTVINQLVTELGFSAVKTSEYPENANKHMGNEGLINIQKGNQIIPNSKESLLDSITEIHYVDVGLNSAGAYLTDGDVIERLSKRLMQRPARIRFVLHGTPRQWCDSRRAWIGKEKEKMLQLLKSEAQKSGGKLHVCERLYFAGKPPSLQMHFEIIENLEVG
ncbi:uncharacterized protein LOC130783418 isoform X3 [Actinidia eriantha]|uniref:uncharacterized protein LOC130783418 isoform X3 n=1 Tax=Actinidia eriantha TaxID=165200 RepID=UPI002587923C|nr:uncharacterized protein LOC130783418 isoform X3 [Actinidia eriantha]